jgi:hypothetical protein
MTFEKVRVYNTMISLLKISDLEPDAGRKDKESPCNHHKQVAFIGYLFISNHLIKKFSYLKTPFH